MAVLSFPATLNEFFGGLAVRAVTFVNREPVESNQMADGTILRASLGAALWQGVVTLRPEPHLASKAFEAKLSVLQRPGASFLIYDPRDPWPADDKNGTKLGSATPQIMAVNADARRMSLKQMPAGYKLTAGDMLSFQYGTNPVRYALHRLVESVTVSGAGNTPLFEVTPNIRTGAAVSTPVQLVKPYCKAVFSGDPSYGNGSILFTEGAQFPFIQTLG